MVAAQVIQDQETRHHKDVRKLTDKQIARIRELWGTGKHSQAQIAVMFQVTQGYISQLVTEKARATKRTYKREISLLDGQEHTYAYGETGEQIAVLDTEDAKQARIATLMTERRALEKRIREINNELADLDGLPF
jgi:predicted XRE-type DNA-binding protein